MRTLRPQDYNIILINKTWISKISKYLKSLWFIFCRIEMTYSMKIENSQKSIPKILFGTIYLAMRSNFNKSDKEERGERGRRQRGEKGILITSVKHLWITAITAEPQITRNNIRVRVFIASAKSRMITNNRTKISKL